VPRRLIAALGVRNRLLNKGEALKIRVLLLVLTGLVLTGVVGFQMMTATAHIPDGNRIVVTLTHVAIAALSVGLVASLYLIGKDNRNIASYLKAYNVIGVVLVLSQCGAWMEKFNGPDKQIVSEDRQFEITVPSNWAALKEPKNDALVQVMDWAGTSSLAIYPGPELGEIDSESARLEMRSRIEQMMSEKSTKIMENFACGRECEGDVYPIISNGKPMHLYSAVKIGSGKVVVVQAGIMASLAQRDSAGIIRMIESVRVLR
jgi:hypothetical protein